MKNLLFSLFVAVFVFAGCNSGGRNYDKKYVVHNMELPGDATMAPPPPSAPRESSEDINESDNQINNQAENKKIIKDGSITFKVKDLEESKKEIDSLLVRFNSYYSSENLDNNEYTSTISYNLSIRIPSAAFEKFIIAVEAGNGKIETKSINARDVTAEYMDIESRLANKRSYLERYRELLKQAKTVKEILEIDEQIRAIVEEIDSAEGRLKYLTDQVSFSTLNLSLVKELGYKYRPTVKGPFGERFKRSLSGGWNGLVNFTLALIRLWPLWIILAIALPLWVTYRRRRKV